VVIASNIRRDDRERRVGGQLLAADPDATPATPSERGAPPLVTTAVIRAIRVSRIGKGIFSIRISGVGVRKSREADPEYAESQAPTRSTPTPASAPA
jgi:hypothetical protein